MISTNFISATKKFSSYEYETHIPAPYIRKTFDIINEIDSAKITICGLGFYELFINGKRITKGLLAPYISNPDDILYYDEYDLTELLLKDKNAGVLTYCGGDYENASCVLSGGNTMEEYAAKLFYNLRVFDEYGVDKIFAEFNEEAGIGVAVKNRLFKAAGNNVIRV